MTGPHYQDDTVTLHHGDCLDVLAELPDQSVHAVITDPPYGLEFMGKEWDKFGSGKQPRIGKPDGSKFRQNMGTPSFTDSGNPTCTNCGGDKYRNGPRKCSCDNPNFGNPGAKALRGFQAWCEQWATECLRVLKPGGHLLAFGGTRTWHRLTAAVEDAGFEIRDSIAWLYGSGFPKSLDVSKAIDKAAGAARERVARVGGALNAGTANGWSGSSPDSETAPLAGTQQVNEPITDAARQWSGWGTALKPAFEPIVVARKPLAGTVAANVLAHGVGALNIDGCRIGTADALVRPEILRRDNEVYGLGLGAGVQTEPAGRWPANVILDESQAAALDEQSGHSVSPKTVTRGGDRRESYGMGRQDNVPAPGDSGGASRFFYTAKADQAERITHNGTAHPTVKPLDLMRWLVRLATPPGGTILEPFAGSGTTVEAAILEGFRCIAIEREADYLPLITQRIHRRRDPVKYLTAAGDDLGLFADDEDGAA